MLYTMLYTIFVGLILIITIHTRMSLRPPPTHTLYTANSRTRTAPFHTFVLDLFDADFPAFYSKGWDRLKGACVYIFVCVFVCLVCVRACACVRVRGACACVVPVCILNTSQLEDFPEEGIQVHLSCLLDGRSSSRQYTNPILCTSI
jgi:hypothetical protein